MKKMEKTVYVKAKKRSEKTSERFLAFTYLEPTTGIEPVTYALRERRSTNWAMLAYSVMIKAKQVV